MRELRKNERGFSIVELMVGLTIGLVIMASLSYLLVNNTGARAELDKSMQQIENGRYAMELLRGELRLAGYYGPSYSFGGAPVALPDPCATDVASLGQALPLAVQGYAQPAINPIGTCLAAGDFTAGNDILVVRRAQTVTVTPAAAVANTTTVYLQANGESHALDVGGSSSFTLTDNSGTAALRSYAVQIYFVSPCDIPATGTSCTGAADDGGAPIPTLKRLELAYAAAECAPAAAPCWKVVPLVEGVQRFHLEYGVDGDGDGTPDGYVDTPADTNAWANVVAVRVYLLARNTKTSVGYSDTKSYTLGNVAVAAGNDAYKRHVFTEIVRLVNVAGRRES
jgi:type IV pilus assembly protein PilW